MTIGIGVLATRNDFKPDTLILVSDTRGSVGTSYTTPGLHKLWEFPSEKLYAVASGSMERAAELLGIIQDEFSALKVRDHGPINSALLSAVKKYRIERGWNEIFPNFLVTKEAWYGNKLDKDQRAQVLEAWRRFDVGCDLIIGTFADTGQALLYLLPSAGILDDEIEPTAICYVLLKTFPGFATIGHGGDNAEFWLCYRNHKLGMKPKRAAYHAYEAKLMAESSAYVNEVTEILVATAKDYVHIHEKEPSKGEWSLDEFRETYKRYGPQSTMSLDA